MTRVSRRGTSRFRATFLLLGALTTIFAACGGKSIRHEGGDETGGDGAEPNGGTSPGGTGFGATGGTAGTGFGAIGGTGFGATGGTGIAGTGARPSIGGTGPTTGGVGGTFPVGGTGVGAAGTGTGGYAGICWGQTSPGLPSPDEPIFWNENARIEWAQSAFGIQGTWYSYDDCNSALMYGLPCTKRDASLVSYDGQQGWTTGVQTACARGVAARVGPLPDGTPAYSIQWGFGIGFPLNDGLPYDANYQCVDGMTFTISGLQPAQIRVNLTTTTTEDKPYFLTVPVATRGTYSLAFRTFAQGPWVTNPEPLDMRRLTNIQFFVFTNTEAETPFDFCISDIRLAYHLVGATD